MDSSSHLKLHEEENSPLPIDSYSSEIDIEAKARGQARTSPANSNPVDWDGPDDPANPHNFTTSRRVFISLIWVAGNLVTCIASSIFSSGATLIANEFHLSSTVTTLGVSLFLLGYTVGPPVWRPLSERYGRRYPMLVGIAMFSLFCLPVALAKNPQTMLIGRFFCGMFGAAPLSIVGGGLVDIWDSIDRGVAMAGCIGAIFGSPILAVVTGDFIAASYIGWRWDNWLSAVVGLACTLLVLFGLPETYAPGLLQQRARRIRRTGHPDAHSVDDGEVPAFRKASKSHSGSLPHRCPTSLEIDSIVIPNSKP